MAEGNYNNRHHHHNNNVNFTEPRGFSEKLKSSLSETFFPDDPFRGFSNDPPKKRLIKGIKYFVPVFEWLPKYNFSLFRYDLLAGITIASLAIPQGISYANLARVPPVIGLCKHFYSLFLYNQMFSFFFLKKYYLIFFRIFSKWIGIFSS